MAVTVAFWAMIGYNKLKAGEAVDTVEDGG